MAISKRKKREEEEIVLSIPQMQASLKKNACLFNHMRCYLISDAYINKRNNKTDRERLNEYIGILRYEVVQIIEQILLKHHIFADEVGHCRMVATAMGIEDKNLFATITKRLAGALRSPFQSEEYKITPFDNRNNKYLIELFFKNAKDNITFEFKKW
jgi:hypothetical protein